MKERRRRQELVSVHILAAVCPPGAAQTAAGLAKLSTFCVFEWKAAELLKQKGKKRNKALYFCENKSSVAAGGGPGAFT